MASRRQERFLLALVLAAVVSLWVVPLPSELWLDETVTRWVVRIDLPGLLGRAVEYQWSPLYFFLPWASLHTGVASQEVLLRVPSLIAMGLAGVGVFRIGRRLCDTEAGLLACVVFVTTGSIAFAASDARPYAVGVAFVVYSMLAYVRWLAKGRTTHQVIAALLGVLAVYTQPLFLLPVAAQLLDLLQRTVRRRLPLRALFAHVGVLVAGLLPMSPIFLALLRDRAELSWAEAPTLIALQQALAPGSVILVLLLSAVSAWGLGGSKVARPASRPEGSLGLLLGWLLVPVLSLCAVSLLGSAQLFVPKYFIGAMPALALLAGLALRSLGDARVRLLVATTLVLAAWIQLGDTNHREEGWRDVSRFLGELDRDANTPTLVRGGLIESLRPAWLDDQEKRGYLLAPLSAYPIDAQTIPLPANLTTREARAWIGAMASGRLRQANEFLLVTPRGRGIYSWVRGWASTHGFVEHPLGTYGILEVSSWSRPSTEHP